MSLAGRLVAGTLGVFALGTATGLLYAQAQRDLCTLWLLVGCALTLVSIRWRFAK